MVRVLRLLPRSSLFPYTTLFRSSAGLTNSSSSACGTGVAATDSFSANAAEEKVATAAMATRVFLKFIFAFSCGASCLTLVYGTLLGGSFRKTPVNTRKRVQPAIADCCRYATREASLLKHLLRPCRASSRRPWRSRFSERTSQQPAYTGLLCWLPGVKD